MWFDLGLFMHGLIWLYFNGKHRTLGLTNVANVQVCDISV